MTEHQPLPESVYNSNAVLQMQVAIILLAEGKGDITNANERLVSQVERQLGSQIWNVLKAVAEQNTK